VNRLDMNTSGIVIIAKNPYVHNHLADQMKSNTVEKYYYAIVEVLLERVPAAQGPAVPVPAEQADM
jgi:23S rRNA pseudouridine1911/1915/1917 synthase